MTDTGFYQFSPVTILLLLAAFYGGTYSLTLLIKSDRQGTDAFMVANHRVGFGMGAASMTATWIWAASFTPPLPPAIPMACPARSTMACGAR